MGYLYKKKYYKILFSIVDIIGYAITLPARIFRNNDNRAPKKILVIRLDHIGDVVAATSVLGPLRKAFPKAHIDMIVPPVMEELIAPIPYLDGVIKFTAPWFQRGEGSFSEWSEGVKDLARIIREGEYDTCLDLRGDFRHILSMFMSGVGRRIGYGATGGGFLLTDPVPYTGMEHETLRNNGLLRVLGVKESLSGPELTLLSGEEQKAGQLSGSEAIKSPYALLHIVPGHSTKDWTGNGFYKLASYLAEKGIMPVFVGAASDKKAVKEAINDLGDKAKDITGKTGLGVLAALAAKSSVFVGVDSGPSHIAASVGAPTVIIFGGINDPDQWAPKGDNVRVIYPGKNKELSTITAETVIETVDELLEGESGAK